MTSVNPSDPHTVHAGQPRAAVASVPKPVDPAGSAAVQQADAADAETPAAAAVGGPALVEATAAADAVDTGTYCGGCGSAGPAHDRCLARLELEPPRYCARCARRMVVQVTPTGWTARCSRHGEISSAG